MKQNKNLPLMFLIMVLLAALYRVIPSRPMGFAPQLAIALFAGAMIKDRKWAFAMPLISLFLSDLLYQLLFLSGLSDLPGLYAGQLTNYLLIAGMVTIGFLMKKFNLINLVLFSLAECIVYFVLSNFFVWLNGAGFARPKTFSGLMLCFADALPFFLNSVLATLLFGAILFGSYSLLTSGNKSTAGVSPKS